ncbi:ZC2HC1C_1 [Blepharisma stoltei]|uniref:C2HC/C3H-type domain-containing protein n=1 Tax=Blepharisma stoltei TaxID=1481888 RepID=A0AAU9JDG5_9CILI|nr:unnamed protein product [Blepharisma stoltei]
MDFCDTSRPISVKCEQCQREFSSSTILFHLRKHHPEGPQLYTPSEVKCSRCHQTVIVSSLLIHSQLCEERNKDSLNIIIEESGDDLRHTCKYCKRKFMAERIEKHQQACELASRKRPLFNMTKQRLPNVYEFTERSHSVSRYSLKLQYPNSKWQKQHLELLKNLQLSSESDSTYENYITCPHCSRKFGPIQAEKHIEKCKDIINKPKPPPTVLRKNRFPSIKKDKELTIRTKSLGAKNRSFVIESSEPRIVLNETLDVESISAVNNQDILYTPNIHTSYRIKRFDQGHLFPLIENDAVITKLSYLDGSDTSQKMFTPKAKTTKQRTYKERELKPSRTIKTLEKPEYYPGSRDLSRHSSHTHLASNRSQSTQRLKETTAICQHCDANVPLRARYCMMCGSIRM